MLRLLFPRTVAATLFAFTLGACSPAPAPAPSHQVPGAGAGGVAGAAGSGLGGAGMAGMGGAATGGAGAGGGGAAGAAGAAGTAGSGGSGGLDPTKGVQDDPGTEGDGVFEQPPPYDQLPPEALSHIGGAPEGTVTGPFLHTQTG